MEPLIVESKDLEIVAQAAATAPVVALDTEADSLHSYPEKLCLIQVGIGDQQWLIDPLCGLDLSPLLDALADKELLFHAADYDLRLLFRAYGFRPYAIFDTMWASRLVGHERFGLESLVQHYFEIQLEKGPQTANWALRPLTPRMIDYARNDVRYLPELAQRLRKHLAKEKRLGWHAAVCDRVIETSCVLIDEDGEDAWRIRGSNRLNRSGLAYLKRLWYWRETEALKSKRPPFFVLAHELLLNISDRAANKGAWRQLVPKRMPDRRKRDLEQCIRDVSRIKPEDWPERLRFDRRRRTDAEKREADRLKIIRDQAAERLQLDPTLIASRSMLARLASKDQGALNDLMPWQQDLLGLNHRT